MPNIKFTVSLDDRISKSLKSINDKFAKFNPLKKTQKGVDKTVSKMEGLNRQVDKTANSILKLQRKSLTASKEQKKAINKEIQGHRQLQRELKQEIRLLKKRGKSSKSGFQAQIGGGVSKGMTSFASKMGGIGVGIGAIFGGGMIAKGILETTAEMEKLNAVLTNTLGSTKKASESMQMITDIASKTPFEVNTLTGSFIKLVNRGFKPTKNEIISLGDLASSTGKDFDQLAEALLDAQTSEFERLKEFGIKAEKNGDLVKFTFKGVTTEVKNSDKAITDYILSLGKVEGVSGSMAAISETLTGKVSNMKDAFAQTQLVIGSAFSPLIISSLNKIIELINRFRPTLEANLIKIMPKVEVVFNNLINWVDAVVASFDNIKLIIEPLKTVFKRYIELFNNWVTLIGLGGDKLSTINNIALALRGILGLITITLRPQLWLWNKILTIAINVKRIVNSITEWLDKNRTVLYIIGGILTVTILPTLIAIAGVTGPLVVAIGLLASPLLIAAGAIWGMYEGIKALADWLDPLPAKANAVNTEFKKVSDTTRRISTDMQNALDATEKLRKKLLGGLGAGVKSSGKKKSTYKPITSNNNNNNNTLTDNDTVLKTDRSVTNVTLNVDKLVEGGINITTQNIQESNIKIQEIVTKSLQRALADATTVKI